MRHMPLLMYAKFDQQKCGTNKSERNLILMSTITSLIVCHVIMQCKYLIKLVILPSLKLLIYTTFFFRKKLYYL